MNDRAEHVTALVADWLLKDDKWLAVAREYAASHELHFLVPFVVNVVHDAKPGTRAWEVGQQLASADWALVEWRVVAERLRQADLG